MNFQDKSREEKLQFLLAAVYEIIDTDNLNTYPEDYEPSTSEYRDAAKSLTSYNIPRFPVREDFYKALDEVYGLREVATSPSQTSRIRISKCTFMG